MKFTAYMAYKTVNFVKNLQCRDIEFSKGLLLLVHPVKPYSDYVKEKTPKF